ncbi:MAG: hypothetical protein Q4D13_05465 [Erysipelotrichaceae bacterium]|nr:hypothetical protein [Erysipelotrichaceae bacterium]
MILTYEQCIEIYGTDYRIKKEIKEGRLFQKGKGIYSEDEYCSDLDIISVKYPRAVFTGESAFYYYGLSDVIPDKYFLATKRTDTRINDPDIRQVFVNEELFDMGKTTMVYHKTEINIYSRERLLVDLMRSKGRIAFDYYKEIVSSYRRIIDELDFYHVEECAAIFKNSDRIMEAISLEVL